MAEEYAAKMQTPKFYDNEIVKAGDANFGNLSSFRNLARAARLAFGGRGTFLSGGLLSAGSGLSVLVAPFAAFYEASESELEGGGGAVFSEKEVEVQLEKRDAARFWTIEARAQWKDDETQERRAFFDEELENPEYRMVAVKSNLEVEVKAKEGSEGSAAAVDEGWVKLGEVSVAAGSETVGQVLNATAENCGEENAAWTADKLVTWRLGSLAELKKVLSEIANDKGLKDNVVKSSAIDFGVLAGQVNATLLPVGAAVSDGRDLSILEGDSVKSAFEKVASRHEVEYVADFPENPSTYKFYGVTAAFSHGGKSYPVGVYRWNGSDLVALGEIADCAVVVVEGTLPASYDAKKLYFLPTGIGSCASGLYRVLSGALVSIGGASDYDYLLNKPKIAGVELSGDKTPFDLHISGMGDELPLPGIKGRLFLLADGYSTAGLWYDDGFEWHPAANWSGEINKDYCTFRNISKSTSTTVKIGSVMSGGGVIPSDIFRYGQDGQSVILFRLKGATEWTEYTGANQITIPPGQAVEILHANNNDGTGSPGYFSAQFKDKGSWYYLGFEFTGGEVRLEGSIMSLLGPDWIGKTELPAASPDNPNRINLGFKQAFQFNSNIKKVSYGFLPATKLIDACYYEMFGECPSLVSAPALPAKELKSDCYYGMFSGCTSLAAPAPMAEFSNSFSGLDSCLGDMYRPTGFRVSGTKTDVFKTKFILRSKNWAYAYSLFDIDMAIDSELVYYGNWPR